MNEISLIFCWIALLVFSSIKQPNQSSRKEKNCEILWLEWCCGERRQPITHSLFIAMNSTNQQLQSTNQLNSNEINFHFVDFMELNCWLMSWFKRKKPISLFFDSHKWIKWRRDEIDLFLSPAAPSNKSNQNVWLIYGAARQKSEWSEWM